MKKSLLFIGGLLLSVGLFSCTSKPASQPDTEEQKQVTEEIITQLDSLAEEIGQIAETQELIRILNPDTVALSETDRLVKPDFLVTENELSQLQTLSQKYRALALLVVDTRVQGLYEPGEDTYMSHALQQISTDLNDEAVFQLMSKSKDQLVSKQDVMNFYDLMKKSNRVDYFYQTNVSFAIELVYVLSKKFEIFEPYITDATAQSYSRHIALSVSGVEKLAETKPEMSSILEAIKPLKQINAETADQFKQQIIASSTGISAMRKSILE